MNNIQKNAKKFILVLVLLVLFNFCCPKKVNAGLVEDITAAPAKIFWLIEEGVLSFLNNIFTEDSKDAKTRMDYDDNGDIVTRLSVYLTPETIIKGKYILFDANIFRNIEESTTDEDKYYDDGDEGAVVTGKTALRKTVSGWYYALRNFAIVALLSVLVYVGIRMIISTVAQDKAKYKVMFKDWLVALCLVILMHYVMITILNVTSMITEALGGGENTDIVGNITSIIEGVLSNDEDEAYTYTKDEDAEEVYTLADAYANIIVLFGIIIYTFIFGVKYLKREFTIIFLIMLGPVSCITYPIDKITDGKAQAFNRWFSEFLYQVIIQPFHLLLYIVLIGSASQLANTNVIYALVCFAVMGPAEKFLKEMFGFKDKLGSPLGAMATGAAASQLFNKLRNGVTNTAGGKNGGAGKDGTENNSTPQQLPPRQVDTNALVGGDGGPTSSTPTQNGASGPLAEGEGTNPSRPQLTSGANEATGELAGEAADAAVGVGAAEAVDEEIGDRDNNAKYSLSEQMDNAQEEKAATDNIANAVEKGIEDSKEENGADSETVHQHNNPEDEKQQSDENTDETNKIEDEKDNQKKGINPLRHPFSAFDSTKIGKTHSQRMAKKWGSTSRGRRWVNRGKKFTKGALKGVAKGTLIGGAAAIATSAALLTGHGREALGIAGGVAGMAINKGRKTIKGVAKSAKGAAKDYRQGFRSNEKREELALRDFKADGEQQDKAVLSYRKNHNGEDPTNAELNQEMEDRFELSRYGLSDAQIDAAIGNYQELREKRIDKLEENGNLNDETWLDADHKALEETVFAAKLADDYSKKDFRSEKTMKEAVDSLTKRFQDLGVKDKNLAQSSAITYLKEASKIKGAEINLPAGYETVDVPVSRGRLNVQTSLGIQNSNLSSNQIERINNITLRLRDQGYSDVEIQAIAESAADSRVTSAQVINKYATKMEFLENKGQQAHAAKVLEKMGKEVTPENIKEEMKDRLVLKETFNVRPQDVSHIRNEEIKSVPTSQVKAAREFAVKNRGQLGNSARMETEKQLLIEKLEKGGSSNAKKDAENIIKLAGQYAGTSTTNNVKGTKGKKRK